MHNLTETEILDLWNMIFNISLHMLHDKSEGGRGGAADIPEAYREEG